MAAVGFIYLAEGLSPEKQHGVIRSTNIEMKIYGVDSYEKACEVAKKIVGEGVESILLCAGFGYRGTTMIKEAVPGIPVASAKFDYHPGIGGSGDSVFQ
ncbi:MAG: DUF6506 family protein [Anaerovoracaceae bacterium]|nr:DUF6506 family protein [Bacillota bacterium]MDY2670926.1 DUF6506 family protein [Anaerovoracaceae bacterium]